MKSLEKKDSTCEISDSVTVHGKHNFHQCMGQRVVLFFLYLCFALKVVNTLLDAFCQTCNAVSSHASESLDILKR